jgi:hypothetical protein
MTKNITLSAEATLIEQARKRAQEEHKSLNVVFREWLFRYAHGKKSYSQFHQLMDKYHYANAVGHFSRDEMNER